MRIDFQSSISLHKDLDHGGEFANIFVEAILPPHGAGLQRYAANRRNVIPPLAANPMHSYPATHYTSISPREMA